MGALPWRRLPIMKTTDEKATTNGKATTMFDDTIAAISTPLGEGGIGIVRVSGPDSIGVCNRVFRGRQSLEETPTHSVNYGKIVDPKAKRVVDEVLVTVMRGPRSYTAEDIVEISGHGGLTALEEILGVVLREGARLAEPGEFTKRAFLNGRMDLSQAEAVIDVIRARTSQGLGVAVAQLQGRLGGAVGQLHAGLLAALAGIEAHVDYPEEDLAPLDGRQILQLIDDAIGGIGRLLETARFGRMVREGLRIAIVGKPNVGKSSLLNALLLEDRAIVTEIPGTTRDLIEENLNLGGFPVVLIDTAGIRETSDAVESIGVKKTRDALRYADLVFLVLDGTGGLAGEDRQLMKDIADLNTMVLINKIDKERAELSRATVMEAEEFQGHWSLMEVSALEGTGLKSLQDAVKEMFIAGEVRPGESAIVSNARQEQSLRAALEELKAAADTIRDGLPLDLASVELRRGIEWLGKVTGDTASEDLLDEIFSRFCLGK